MNVAQTFFEERAEIFAYGQHFSIELEKVVSLCGFGSGQIAATNQRAFGRGIGNDDGPWLGRHNRYRDSLTRFLVVVHILLGIAPGLQSIQFPLFPGENQAFSSP